jgi:hypothetical protein
MVEVMNTQIIAALLVFALMLVSGYTLWLTRNRNFHRAEANKYFDLWIEKVQEQLDEIHLRAAQNGLGHRERCQTVITGRKEACYCGYIKQKEV